MSTQIFVPPHSPDHGLMLLACAEACAACMRTATGDLGHESSAFPTIRSHTLGGGKRRRGRHGWAGARGFPRPGKSCEGRSPRWLFQQAIVVAGLLWRVEEAVDCCDRYSDGYPFKQRLRMDCLSNVKRNPQGPRQSQFLHNRLLTRCGEKERHHSEVSMLGVADKARRL